MIKTRNIIATIVLSLSTAAAAAPEPTLTIDAAPSPTPVAPVHYGLMTEEINHSYDGGAGSMLNWSRIAPFWTTNKTPSIGQSCKATARRAPSHSITISR
jgi:hypothetical protein